MACKLPHEELNEIYKVLEAKYTGEELEKAKSEMKLWYESERIQTMYEGKDEPTEEYDSAKTLALNMKQSSHTKV